MGRGFLSGIFMGAIVSAVLIFVSSQTLERQTLSFPKPSASAVEVPAGTEFDQARPESDPVVPQTETRPDADAVVEAPVPDDAPDTPPALDTTALEVPTPEVEAPGTLETVNIEEGVAPTAPGGESQAAVGDVSELTTPEAPAIAPSTETGTPDVAQAPAEDAAPDASSEESAPQVETDIAALPNADAEAGTSQGSDTAPAVTSEDTAPSAPIAPEISTEPSLPEPSVAVIEPTQEQSAPEPAASDEAPVVAIAEPDPVPEPATEPDVVANAEADEEVPSFLRPVEVLENAGDVETDRLPQVSDAEAGDDSPAVTDTPEPDVATDTVPVPEPDAAASGEPETEIAALPTIRRPGVETPLPQARDEDEAAAADDEAAEPDPADLNLPALAKHAVEFENPEGNPLLSIVLVNTGAPLTPTQLEELPEFLAFGVEAGDPDAAATAQYYRDAGREVVMIPSLPQGATPQDVEQALRVNFETVTQAVAVMDVSGGSFQSDREAVSQVVDVIADSGHGLITFPRGLNTAHQRATRAGVATGLIFRQLDGQGEGSPQIQRTLDRAAFRARQDEAVILVGTTDATTLIALVEWVLGNRADSVTLAPISAALAGGG